MAENNLSSRVLKWILAGNYYDNIIAEVENTEFYSQKLKNLLKQVDKEMRIKAKNKHLDTFYKNAKSENYLNNLDTHEQYFKELSRLSCSDLEEHMVKFLESKGHEIIREDE